MNATAMSKSSPSAYSVQLLPLLLMASLFKKWSKEITKKIEQLLQQCKSEKNLGKYNQVLQKKSTEIKQMNNIVEKNQSTMD